MTTKIEGEVELSPQDDGRHWVLSNPLKVWINDRIIAEVPAGFETDFASVPRLFWRLFPPASGRYRVAAIVHDYLYEQEGYPKISADAIFLDLMEGAGVSRWKRYPIFLSVLLFGGFFREVKG